MADFLSYGSIFVLQIQLRFINPLKNLRRLGIKMVTDVFLDWESYQFRTEEIDAVFHGAVWPQVNLDFFIWPRYLLLLPLLNIHLSLFFYIKPLFLAVLEHFSLPPLPPKAQELVSAVPWHLYLRLI